MSVEITVSSAEEADAIIEAVRAQLEDWGPFFVYLGEHVLPVAQVNQWDRAFGLGLIPSLATMEARRRRWGYYQIQPDIRAYPAGPYLEWTGSLRHATDFFTEIQPKQATINPSKNYEGPIKGDAFAFTVGALVPEANIWDVAGLDRHIDGDIERYLTETVLPAVERSFAGVHA